MALFKKKFTLSTKTQLKNSHKRKLLKKLKEIYPSFPEEAWEALFPHKCNVFSKKLNTKVMLYCVKEKDCENEGTPIFFSPTSKSNEKIFPTLETLWKYPDMCTTYYVDTHICKFIFRGADLMLAGMDHSLSEWENVTIGEPICVKVVGNPFPIGIGYCMKGTAEIKTTGFRDRGVGVYHYYTDKLWEESGSLTPHESFEASQVVPISATKVSAKKEKTKEECLWPSLVNVKAKGPNSSKITGVYKRRAKARMAKRPVFAHDNNKDAVIWYNEELASWFISDNDCFGTDECWAKCESGVDNPIDIKGTWYMWDDEDDDYCVGGLRVRKEVVDNWEDEIESSDEEPEPEPEPVVEATEDGEEVKPAAVEVVEEVVEEEEEEEEVFVAAALDLALDESMEGQLERAFVEVLNGISDEDLPIQQSDIYQGMKDVNEDLDVKQSSFKKLGKFLEKQRSLGRVDLKKKKGKVNVISIDRDEDIFQATIRMKRAHERLGVSKISQRHFDRMFYILRNLEDKTEEAKPVAVVKEEGEKPEEEEEESEEDSEEEKDPFVVKLIANLRVMFPEGKTIGSFEEPVDILSYFFNDLSLLKHSDPMEVFMKNDTEVDLSFHEKRQTKLQRDEETMNCFLTALKVFIKDSDLPIPDSNVLDKMKKVGDINMKSTSWKKLSTFLKKMTEMNFIETKEIDGASISITKITKDHPDLVSHAVDEKILKQIKRANIFDDPKFARSKKTEGAVTIIVMYKPSGRLEPIFGKTFNPKALFTKDECHDTLWKWCENQQIFTGDRKHIWPNDNLWKYVLRNKKDKAKTVPEEFANRKMSKKEISANFERWLQRQVAIVAHGMKPKFRTGDLKKISVYVEKRQGGKKHTTFVWLLEMYGIDLKHFADVARKKFAASTSVQDLPGRTRNGQFVKIQGDVSEEVIGLLENPDTFNIPEKFVEITNKRPL